MVVVGDLELAFWACVVLLCIINKLANSQGLYCIYI